MLVFGFQFSNCNAIVAAYLDTPSILGKETVMTFHHWHMQWRIYTKYFKLNKSPRNTNTTGNIKFKQLHREFIFLFAFVTISTFAPALTGLTNGQT